eukprot:3295830-Rhodomonas_salina.2
MRPHPPDSFSVRRDATPSTIPSLSTNRRLMRPHTSYPVSVLGSVPPYAARYRTAPASHTQSRTHTLSLPEPHVCGTSSTLRRLFCTTRTDVGTGTSVPEQTSVQRA